MYTMSGRRTGHLHHHARQNNTTSSDEMLHLRILITPTITQITPTGVSVDFQSRRCCPPSNKSLSPPVLLHASQPQPHCTYPPGHLLLHLCLLIDCYPSTPPIQGYCSCCSCDSHCLAVLARRHLFHLCPSSARSASPSPPPRLHPPPHVFLFLQQGERVFIFTILALSPPLWSI